MKFSTRRKLYDIFFLGSIVVGTVLFTYMCRLIIQEL